MGISLGILQFQDFDTFGTPYCRTWKKSYPYIFDVFTSDILNLGLCLKAVSTLGIWFTSYSTIGSPSNFRLPKLKMANKKNTNIMFLMHISGLNVRVFSVVLFWVNTRTSNFMVELWTHISDTVEFISMLIFLLVMANNLNLKLNWWGSF